MRTNRLAYQVANWRSEVRHDTRTHKSPLTAVMMMVSCFGWSYSTFPCLPGYDHRLILMIPTVTWPQVLAPGRLLARLLSSGRLPWLLVGAALVPVGLLAGTAYYVLVQDYLHGCVYTESHSDSAGDNAGVSPIVNDTAGSFLAQAADSLAYNYASMGGNTGQLQGLRDYNTRRGDICSAALHQSQNAYVSQCRFGLSRLITQVGYRFLTVAL
jgi:hypothetical protein